MTDIIRKIINHDNLDEIYEYAKSSLFTNGPSSVTTLEIISYLSLFAPDFFDSIKDDVLSMMGVFYKKPKPVTLQGKLFELYGEYIQETYDFEYTPVQANIIKQIHTNQNFSFSAPTSTGKSFVFRHLIKESMHDVVIIVPSRALINEYYNQVCQMVRDKHVGILTFVDIINTKHTLRRIFILTPERAKDLFRHKDYLNIEFLLFDEAQLSDEDSSRGLLFDSIVRRAQVAFPKAKCIFAHPFVDNPEAQLIKNHFDQGSSVAMKYEQRTVGQIFFAHQDGSFFHFGLDVKVMGKQKIKSDFDPLMRAIRTGGSILVFTTKTSIYKRDVFETFKTYIDQCQLITNPRALALIEQFRESIGASVKSNGIFRSQMLEYMKRGIVVHHGSLPLQLRLILERFTQDGFCKICFATSTLEQGINMPFDVVYLNTFRQSDALSMKNLIGRAGRSSPRNKFDYGSIVVKASNMSAFRVLMMQGEGLRNISLLESDDSEESDFSDFKNAIRSGTFSDEYNLTNTEVERLSSPDVDTLVNSVLSALFSGGELVSLLEIDQDEECRLSLYRCMRELYQFHLKRELSEGEESVLNTAIKIMLWRVHTKTFKEICQHRYAFAARIRDIRNLRKQYKAAKSDDERKKIYQIATNLQAKFIRGFDELPNKKLHNYGIYRKGTKAADVDYDRIVFDTYDYLDKLIGFRLSDVYYAILHQYYQRYNDTRADKLAKYFKYGTDDETEIWMLRYGMSFDDIAEIKPYVISINEQELILSEEVRKLPQERLSAVERYMVTED